MKISNHHFLTKFNIFEASLDFLPQKGSKWYSHMYLYFKMETVIASKQAEVQYKLRKGATLVSAARLRANRMDTVIEHLEYRMEPQQPDIWSIPNLG